MTSDEVVICEWKRLDLSPFFKERLIEGRHPGEMPIIQCSEKEKQDWTDSITEYRYCDGAIMQLACLAKENTEIKETVASCAAKGCIICGIAKEKAVA